MGKLHMMNPRKKVRARNKDGTLKADDPSTPDINEAWEEVPVKKAKKAKSE